MVVKKKMNRDEYSEGKKKKNTCFFFFNFCWLRKAQNQGIFFFEN
jgi:hypothetical protein